ncbi:uncharacterized protein K460DRAFT_406399 [Cucurbitaria berberidis CBS 394.84]|uniref:Chromodomain-helicase-DNA-binding protein 1-like C-terminal domain-containing protein n=1 Tax=Cucurbitaria berberidis CBS 394.84 TaxID=1168544 RepID=A0A9P4GJ08_9PLEO|nr:uncharacterized protein K460DRAFT_406399 [Cucurbitaria berberidis CBS 394.84]KAF1846177.1 hypothetical protein K460DRAFT_406399 [Cucurbitaria berberidis CBS 394.84]
MYEAAAEVDPTPPFAVEESANEEASDADEPSILRKFNGVWEVGNHDASSVQPAASAHDPPLSFAGTDLPPIDSLSLVAIYALQSLELNTSKERGPLRKSPPQSAPELESPTNKLDTDSEMQTDARDGEHSQATPPLITLSRAEQAQMETYLTPVHAKLCSLKATTPESLPPYNPRLRTNSHAQVIKSRLLPVGEFIVRLLAQAPEEKRGMLELKLCRHIAVEYWPLPVTDMTHLRIQEMYRNAMFRKAAQATGEKGSPHSLEPGSGSAQHQPNPRPGGVADPQQDAHPVTEAIEGTREMDE